MRDEVLERRRTKFVVMMCGVLVLYRLIPTYWFENIITCPHDLKFKLLPRKNRVEKDMRAGVKGFETRKNISNMFLR